MKEKLLNIYYNTIGSLAKRYVKKHKPYVLGVTGSVGKTSCRLIVNKLLEDNLEDKKIYTSAKNYNGRLGFILSIFRIDDYTPSISGLIKAFCKIFYKTFFGKKEYDIIFLEYGIDSIGEMDFMLSICKPNVGIFTKIDNVHAEKLGSPDTIAEEKLKLILNTQDIAFLNSEEMYARKVYHQIHIDKFFYTLNDSHGEEGLDIYFQNYNLDKKENIVSSFDCYINDTKYFDISTNLIGKENAGYICLGFTVLDILYFYFYKKSFIEEYKGNSFELDFELQPGRFTLLNGIKESIIIDSSYNAAPFSMRKTIENVLNIKNAVLSDYKIITVVGDMKELGDFEEQEHRKLGRFLSQVSDKVFMTGNLMEKYLYDELIKMGFGKEDAKHFKDFNELGAFLKKFLESSDERYIILFKGSQNTIFLEESVKYILQNDEDSKYLPRQASFWLTKKGV